MRINIDLADYSRSKFALFDLGFRPFFLVAAVFSMVSMSVWFGIYFFGWEPGLTGFSATVWHAHEMIYGYAMAVIAGFLLTAVNNWTGVQTLHGYKLASLLALWIITRVLFSIETVIPIIVIAVIENLFILLLIVSLAIPIIKTKSWGQFAVLTKLAFLFFSNILFYLGVLNIFPEGVRWGIYSGLYLIIGLILMIGRRVIPFFITNGVGYAVQVKNWRWVDMSSLTLFFAFWFFASFTSMDSFSALLAILLFFILGIRLWGWHTPGIWKKPLLWILYAAYGFIVFGFLLIALAYTLDVTPYLSVHAFAAGGVGMMTMGMMARVSLGHTGRNIGVLPPLLPLALILSAAAATVRVVFPLLFPDYYSMWIGGSQLLWIAAFIIFVWIYTPILISPRFDPER